MRWKTISLLGILVVSMVLSPFSSSNPGEWWNSTFTKCQNITITNTGSSTLTNFPAYVNISKDNDMQGDYDDLRFVNDSCNNGGNELAYELENYTTTNAHTWVKVNLSTGDNIISVYYGNAGASAGENPTAVWDVNYKMVHHFAETSGNYTDSTSNENNVTTINVVTRQASAPVGISPEFDGTTADYMSVPYDSSLDFGGGNLTIEMWQNTDSILAEQGLISKNVLGEGWNLEHYPNLNLLFQAGEGDADRDDTNSNPIASTNVWYHIVVVWDTNADDTIFYADGEIQTHDPGEDDMADWSSQSVPTYIGTANPATLRYPFNGEIDEVRLSNVARSSDWVNQTYQLQANQGTYVVFGDEEEEPLLDSTPPTYSDNSTNSTYAGQDILHSLNWSDDINLSGYVFQFCNETWNGTNCPGVGFEYQEVSDERTNCGLSCDGDWGTGACLHHDFNYTKPSNALDSSLLQFDDNSVSGNLTINQSCWDAYPDKLVFKEGSQCLGAFDFECYNGTDWVVMGTSTTGTLNEEAIWWNISSLGDYGWVNDSFVAMTGTGNWSNVTKTITSTVGDTVAWCVHANDTSDNWNSTSCVSPFSYVTTKVYTCDCPISGNWNIDCVDNCDIQACDMQTNNVLINGIGRILSLRNITNATRVRIQGGCRVRW